MQGVEGASRHPGVRMCVSANRRAVCARARRAQSGRGSIAVRGPRPEGQVLSEGQEGRSGLSAGKRAPVMGLNDEAELSMELLRNTNYPGSYTRSFSAHPKQLLPDGPCVITQLGRHQQCGTLLAASNQPGNATGT